jgi:hypothetical protein
MQAWTARDAGLRKIPVALWTFTASVSTVFVVAGLIWLVIRQAGYSAPYLMHTTDRIWTVSFVVSFFLSLTSFVIAWRKISPVHLLVQVGSGLLMLIDVLGLVLY